MCTDCSVSLARNECSGTMNSLLKTYDGSGETFESGFDEGINNPCSRHHAVEGKNQMSSLKSKPAILKSSSPEKSYRLNDTEADRFSSVFVDWVKLSKKKTYLSNQFKEKTNETNL